MTTCLDLSELRLSARGQDTVLITQPGFAYLTENSAPVIGSSALTKVKLHPAQIHSRFWSELSVEPIDSMAPKVRHHADIAWHALKDLAAEIDISEVIACVPSSFDENNLTLLAGIFESLGIKVKAFINRAISAGHAASANIDGLTEVDFFHIEMQHHQTLVTPIQSSASKLKIGDVQRIPAGGILRLQDKWLHIIRERLIASSRFDPMHSGDTEQQLFSQLYDQIILDQSHANVRNNTLKFSVIHKEQTYTEEFSAKDLAHPFQSLLSDIRAITGGALLLLDSHFKNVPGIDLTNDDLLLSNKNSVLDSASEIGSHTTTTSDIPYIREVGIPTPKSKPVNSGRGSSSHCFATHLLLEAVANPAADYKILPDENFSSLTLERSADNPHILFKDNKLLLSHRADELLVNGQIEQEGYGLGPGDIIHLSSVNLDQTTPQLTAIAVLG